MRDSGCQHPSGSLRRRTRIRVGALVAHLGRRTAVLVGLRVCDRREEAQTDEEEGDDPHTGNGNASLEASHGSAWNHITASASSCGDAREDLASRFSRGGVPCRIDC